MKAAALLVLICLILSGCSSKGGGSEPASNTPGTVDPSSLREGFGAVQGLLIDDRYRPLMTGTILLQPIGLVASPDANGVFYFLDVAPGTYQLRVDVPEHEASSVTVEVEEGVVAETNLVARRIMSEGGTIITQEYASFVPCSASLAGLGITYSCFDVSGQSYRPGGQGIDLREHQNATFLITEIKTEHPGYYQLVVREDDGTPQGGDTYGLAYTHGGDYAKIVMRRGEAAPNATAWENDKLLAALMFYQGENLPLPDVPVGDITLRPSRTGASYADKAQIVQTLFLGEPEHDVETFCVVCA